MVGGCGGAGEGWGGRGEVVVGGTGGRGGDGGSGCRDAASVRGGNVGVEGPDCGRKQLAAGHNRVADT